MRNILLKQTGLFLGIILIFIASSLSSYGQIIQNYKMKIANNAYDKYLYGEAIPTYEEIIHTDPSNIEAKKKLATCYRMTNDTRNAERMYGVLVKEDSIGLLNKLYYAQALAENGKYDEAKVWYKKYDNALAIDGRGKRFLKTYEGISKLYRDSASWGLELLSINSPQSDFSPVYYKRGLVFCSARQQGGAVKHVFGWDQSAFLNLYYVEDTSTIKGKKYHTPLIEDVVSTKYDSSGHVDGHSEDTKNSGNDSYTLGYYGNTFLKEEEDWITSSNTLVHPFSKQVNSKYHEGPSSFSHDQDSIVLTRNGFHGGKLQKSKDGVSKLKIYSARFLKGKWEKPKPIKFNKFQYYVKFTGLNTLNKKNTGETDTAYVREIELDDDQFSISHPSLSNDNKKLFFVSDAPIGFGGTDIYVSDFVDGKWSAPLNCGKNVNTEGNEMFPYVDENGNLYFSSDGWGGLGGLDIYYAETEMNIFGTKDNIFKKCVNLGFPINSKKDDFGIIADKNFTHGYFSSNRRRGANDDDIFRFRYEGVTTISVLGSVVKKADGFPLDSAKVTIADVNGAVIATSTTPKYGAFNIPNLKTGMDYIATVERKGYHTKKVNLNTTDLKRGDTTKIKVELESKEIFIYASGHVFGEDDKLPMGGVKIRIYNNCTGQSEELYTDSEGNFKTRLKENCCYAITALKDNCGVNSTVVSTVGISSDKTIPVLFSMLCKGDVVKIDNIYYDLGKADIKEESKKELDKLLVLFNKYPDMRIEVRSHTDSRGSDDKNLLLSDQRAKAVDQYFTEKGIAANKIIGKGYGEKMLLNKCNDGIPCTEEEHAINRRTEFAILTMGKPMAQSKILSEMAGNCQNYVENVIKKEENDNKEPAAFKRDTIPVDHLSAFGKNEPNPNAIAPKQEVKPVITPVVKEEVKPVVAPVLKKEEPKPVVAPVVKKEEPIAKPIVKEEVKPVVAPVVKEEVKPVVAPVVKKEEPVAKPIVKEEVKPVVAPVVKEEVKPVVAPVVKKEEPVAKPIVKEEVKPVVAPVVKEEVKPVVAPVVKKEEPKPIVASVVKKEEPVVKPIVKEEVKPVVAPVVKKEEPKPIVAPVVKKEEPVAKPIVKDEVKPVIAPVVKKEEPKPVVTPVVKKEEPKPMVAPVVKKEEPKPVLVAPVVKKEEPKPVVAPVVKKEEPKPVVVAPVVKKEEPKPVAEDDPFGGLLSNVDKTATNTCTIKGSVFKKGTTEGINTTKLILKSDGKEIATTNSVLTGTFSFTKLEAGKDYEIFAERKGYLPQKISVSSSSLQPGQTGNVKVYLDLDPNQKDLANEPDVLITLKGKVTDSKTNAPAAGATIVITDNIDKTSREIKTDFTGGYSIVLRKQAHFTIKASKGTCVSDPVNKSTIGINASQTMDGNLVMKCQ